MIWNSTECSKIVGPFKVDDRVNINADDYCKFLSKMLFLFVELIKTGITKIPVFISSFSFLQEDLSSSPAKLIIAHLARKKDTKLMKWLQASADINPIESIKKDVDDNAKYHSTKKIPEETIKITANNVTVKTVEIITLNTDKVYGMSYSVY